MVVKRFKKVKFVLPLFFYRTYPLDSIILVIRCQETRTIDTNSGNMNRKRYTEGISMRKLKEIRESPNLIS